MAFRRTPEEKAAEQAERARKEKEAADERAQREKEAADERARQEFLASPAGQATKAKGKERGDRFSEIQLLVANSSRSSQDMDAPVSATTTTESAAHHLAVIEDVGWHLEHVGCTFMTTGEEVTVKNLRVGEKAGVSGVIVGVYLFRNTD